MKQHSPQRRENKPLTPHLFCLTFPIKGSFHPVRVAQQTVRVEKQSVATTNSILAAWYILKPAEIDE